MNVKLIEIPIPKPGPILDLTSNQVLEPNGYFSSGIGGDLLVLDFKTGSILHNWPVKMKSKNITHAPKYLADRNFFYSL
jgi:hypothetical protein